VAYILLIFAGLNNLGSLQYRGGVADFFLKKKNWLCNYSSNLCRCVEQNQLHVMSTWSQLVLLAAMMTCHLVPTKKRNLRWLTTLPLPARFHNIEAMSLHNGINSPASMRHIGRTTFQCKFVLISVFFSSFNVICGQLINISLILLIFRFTNIEATRVITLAFKSSMEIPLFQWGQVSKPPDLKPYIDSWFTRFEVSVCKNFNWTQINSQT